MIIEVTTWERRIVRMLRHINTDTGTTEEEAFESFLDGNFACIGVTDEEVIDCEVARNELGRVDYE